MPSNSSYEECKCPGSPDREPALLAKFARSQRPIESAFDGVWRGTNGTTLNITTQDTRVSGTLASSFQNALLVGEFSGYFVENLIAFVVSWPRLAAVCAMNGQLVVEMSRPALYFSWDLSIWPQGVESLDSVIGTQRFYRVDVN